jgi:hypothetical protein
MIMNSETKKARRLAEMGTGDPVQIRGCPIGSSPGNGAPRFRTGEVLLCIDRSRDGTLVARPDGSRFRIGHSLGMEIEVRLFWYPISGWDPDEVQSQVL